VVFAVERFGGVVEVCPPETFPATFWVLRWEWQLLSFLYILKMQFEWDPEKNQSNYRKHGISFEEATTVWFDEWALVSPDREHSVGELREGIIGVSEWQTLMLVVFTQRENRIRIISARAVNKRERDGYVRQF
jgi:uncharacterized protein